MPKDSISKTAQVNLQMLANLGVPEAIRMRDALALEGDPLSMLSHLGEDAAEHLRTTWQEKSSLVITA